MDLYMHSPIHPDDVVLNYFVTETSSPVLKITFHSVFYDYLFIVHVIALSACYHSVQNILSSRLLSKNIKVKIYKIIILPVVLYGCETWSLI
jgi:hypothetical protein